ncbi:MAG: glutaminase A [Halieaceae bacterium]|jgi:glutaminase|nr:glutaminase A [Halieaceae bacterium]
MKSLIRFCFLFVLALGHATVTAQDFQALVDRAHAKFKDDQSGANANYIPILDEVPSELFGVVITLRDGTTYVAGDVDYIFSIQSVAKPFTMALVMEEQGLDAVKQKIGVEPTGMPFNSVIAIELHEQRSINPLVNAGAIAAVSMLEASGERQRWNKVHRGLEAFAGENLKVLKDVYKSEAETNYRNRAIANLLYNYDRLYSDPMEATVVYTRQGTLGVSARILAMMGATLANDGINPRTGVRVIRKDYVDEVLAVMLMAGFYDEVGKWAFRAGLPAKTGVGGGIVAVAPGDYAIAAFSPRVNEAGNSVRAMKAIQYISEQLEASLFIDQGE